MSLTLVEKFWDQHKFKLMERYYVDDKDLKQGSYESYHMNGIINEVSTYKDDKKQGLSTYFFENGQSKETCINENCSCDEFYDSGNLKNKGTYKNGCPKRLM